MGAEAKDIADFDPLAALSEEDLAEPEEEEEDEGLDPPEGEDEPADPDDSDDDTEEESEEESEDDEGEEGKGKDDKEEDDKDQPDEAPKVKIKVDGEEREVSLEEAASLASKAAAADERFREASEIKKQAQEAEQKAQQAETQIETLFRALQQDPEAVLKKAGHDFDKLAEEAVVRRMKLEQMDPSERAKLEAQQREQEFKQREEELRRREQALQQQEQQRQATQAQQEAEAELLESFNAAADAVGLTKTDRTISRMAYHAQSALEAGEEIDAEKVARTVREEMEGDSKGWLQSLDADTLLQTLSPDQLKALRGKDIERVKGPSKASKTQPKRGVKGRQRVDSQPEDAPSSRKRGGYTSLDDFREGLEDLARRVR